LKGLKNGVSRKADALVSIIGMPDEKWGEVPVAFIALKSGAKASAEELIGFLRPRISKIKLPRYILFVEALPRNAYGKVLKLELKGRLPQSFSHLQQP
jgi:fatty-acyl-CoA synthase